MTPNVRDLVFEMMDSAPEQFEDVLYALRSTYGGAPEVQPEPTAADASEVEQPPPSGASSSSSGTVSEKFHRFLAEQRERTGAMDHPKFYRPGTTTA